MSIVSASVLNSIQLFIFSEVCFFGGFFWSYYYNLFDLDADVSMSFLFDVMDNCGLPLLNTGLLLISGIAVTWRHHGMHLGIEFGRGVVYSLLLGVAFLFCQYYEYVSTGFSISDGLYGSVFFALTGFHRFHVAIGCSLLLLNVLRSDMQYGKRIRLECSI